MPRMPFSPRCQSTPQALPAGSVRPARGLQRRGVTLLELLVVMLIMLMVTAAAIPVMAPALRNRQLREASRSLNAYIGAAKARAIETGRPVGIVLERFNGLPMANTISQVEVPPPYSGETVNAQCILAPLTGGPSMAASAYATKTYPSHPIRWYQAGMGNGNVFNARMARIGDTIEFSHHGPSFVVMGPDVDSDGSVDVPPNIMDIIRLEVAFVGDIGATLTPVPNQPTVPTFAWDNALPGFQTQTYPYRIIRQPMRSATSPLQLPDGVVIDLVSSGTGASGTFNQANLTGGIGTAPPAAFVSFDPVIMFTATGRLASVTTGSGPTPTSDSVYLLLGRRELMPDVTQKGAPEDIVDQNLSPIANPPNQMPAPPEHFWIGIGAQSGQITAAPTAACLFETTPLTLPGSATLHDVVGRAVSQSWQLVRDGQSVGGR